MSYCFDIPDIYFSRHRKWGDILTQTYKATFIEGVIENGENLEAKLFPLNKKKRFSEEDYKELLSHVVTTIQYRNTEIEKILDGKSKSLLLPPER